MVTNPTGLRCSQKGRKVMPSQKIAHLFQLELGRIFQIAQSKGLSHVDILAKDFHNRVISYPYGPSGHRMPACCGVMYKNMGPEDRVLSAPQIPRSTTVLIRFQLPRKGK